MVSDLIKAFLVLFVVSDLIKAFSCAVCVLLDKFVLSREYVS